MAYQTCKGHQTEFQTTTKTMGRQLAVIASWNTLKCTAAKKNRRYAFLKKKTYLYSSWGKNDLQLNGKKYSLNVVCCYFFVNIIVTFNCATG
jgi:hypothetical protein